MLKKEIVPETRTDIVSDQILADILTSDLQEGEIFLTGDQVIERYDVSRSIAREAISRLQALGILESKQRKGLLITRPDPVSLTRQWLPFYCRKPDLERVTLLAQFRYALEMGAIDLAVSHATEEQLQQLSESAQTFEGIARKYGHTIDADHADAEFHKTILVMTGNSLIAGMHQVLSDYFQASTQLPLLTDGSKAIREHQIIVEAFHRRDAETIRAIMRIHLMGTLQITASAADASITRQKETP